jgi:Domain of unknown function (DUF4158)
LANTGTWLIVRGQYLIRIRWVCGGWPTPYSRENRTPVTRVLDEDELIGNWTLAGDELEQLPGRRGATKLGFALLLRFYAVHGRFPAGRSEIPDQAVAHVARLVDVPAAELGFYEWDGRTIKAHRADIRRYFGFRECSVADADKAAEWLAANVCEKERQAGQVREELLAHLRREQIEPPARDRVRRIIARRCVRLSRR